MLSPPFKIPIRVDLAGLRSFTGVSSDGADSQGPIPGAANAPMIAKPNCRSPTSTRADATRIVANTLNYLVWAPHRSELTSLFTVWGRRRRSLPIGT